MAPFVVKPTSRPRVVMICAQVPSMRSGYGTRNWTLAAALAMVGDLTVFVVGGNESNTKLGLLGEHTVPLMDVSGPELLTRVGLLHPDFVVAAETAIAPLVMACGVPVVISTHNVESVLAENIAALGSGTEQASARRRAKTNRLIERRVFPLAVQVWAVSEADAAVVIEMFASIETQSRVAVVPNVVADPAPLRERTPEVGLGVFFGSLWWEPNQEAVASLVTVSERLELGGIVHRFDVAGSGAPPTLASLVDQARNVNLVGFVPDLGAFLDRAACAVLPVTTGGGSMIKLLDALRNGCPVLTTPQGARGFPALCDGVHAVVRPLGPSFDAACAEMLSAPERFAALGLNGRALVADHYSQTVVNGIVATLVGDTRGTSACVR